MKQLQSLREALRSIPDPRAAKGRQYPLWTVLCVVALGLLSGCVHLSEIVRLGQRLSQAQRRGLGFRMRKNSRFYPAPGYTLYRELLPVSAKSGEVQLSPDTWTLLALNKRTSLNEVIYPGDGLPKVELERLQSVFSDITFRSFEEESFNIRASGRKHPEPREVVVFSVSEPPDQDLLRRGFTVAHLDDLVLRVARLVLRWNADVAYGGRPREGFTASSCRGCRKPLKV